MKSPDHKHIGLTGGPMRGFTLVEVLLALTIGSLLMVSVVGATRALSGAERKVRGRAERLADARRAMQAILAELRNVRRDMTPEYPVVVGHRGTGPNDSDRMDLLVISDRHVRPEAIESDQYEAAFFLERRGRATLPSLMGRRDHALDEYPEDGGIVSVVADHIVGLRFDYYFGGEWLREWPSTRSQPPQAVRVTVAAVSPREQVDRGQPEAVELTSVVTLHAAMPPPSNPKKTEPAAGGAPP